MRKINRLSLSACFRSSKMTLERNNSLTLLSFFLNYSILAYILVPQIELVLLKMLLIREMQNIPKHPNYFLREGENFFL